MGDPLRYPECPEVHSQPTLPLCDEVSAAELFLATGQHGAAELRVGPDGRLPGRAAVTKAAARRRAARGAPNGTQSRAWPWPNSNDTIDIRSAVVCGLSETAQRNRGASALHLSKPHNKLLNRARGGVTMAPLQLRLEPTKVASTTDSGAARVR
eukprot:scaffold12002_cov115-Isochrysis_galbana.AAC.1